MLHILLTVSLIMGATPIVGEASEKVYTASIQRREMQKILTNFTSSLTAEEQRRLLDAHLARGRALTTREKDALMNDHAIEVAEATERFVRAARANRLDEARSALRELVLRVMRAAGANAVFSREDSSNAGGATFTVVQVALIFSCFGSMLFSVITNNPRLGDTVVIPVITATAGWFISGLGWTPFRFQIPGTTRLAHRLGYTPSMHEFWSQVGEYLRTDPNFGYANVRDAAEFRAFLENELKSISLDQACASALLQLPEENR